MIPIAAFLLFATLAQSTSDDKPTVSPYFGFVDGGPAFFISCRNDTTTPLNSGLSRWRSGIRVDGAVVPEPRGEMGSGLTTEIGPGGSWYGIFSLPQDVRSYFPPVKFGALVRWGRLFPLKDGRHTVAVQCGSVWSDDLEFYWDSERPRYNESRLDDVHVKRGGVPQGEPTLLTTRISKESGSLTGRQPTGSWAI